MRGRLLAAVAACVLAGACRRAPSATRGASAAPSASAEPDSARSDGEATAAPLGKALSELDKKDVEAALVKAHWRVTMATQTTSGQNQTIVVAATKGEWNATVKIYSRADDFWLRQLAADQAAVERRGDALVGVVIEDKPDEARILLYSLLGK